MSKLLVSLGAIKENFKILQGKLGAAECGAVVKANAYGLGVGPVSKALKEAGAKRFFVATFEEAMEARPHLPNEEIYIFHGIHESEVSETIKNKLIPVINNPHQLSFWPKAEPCAIHIDTGMTRLGFEYNDLDQVEGYNLVMIMSHLACAEYKQNPKNYEQLHAFDAAAKRFPKVRRSLANSYGIYLPREFHFNIARPGIALYGGNPDFGTMHVNPMKNVAVVKSPIIQVFHNHEAKTVGYGATYNAPAGSVTATIEIGYADGLMRNLSNRGRCYVGDFEIPYAGRVSMDLLTIDITNLPPEFQKIGQEVEIVGDNYTISDMARDASTIEYEVLSRLGPRFERIYI